MFPFLRKIDKKNTLKFLRIFNYLYYNIYSDILKAKIGLMTFIFKIILFINDILFLTFFTFCFYTIVHGLKIKLIKSSFYINFNLANKRRFFFFYYLLLLFKLTK